VSSGSAATTTVKLAHFSDLHLCPDAGGRAQLGKTLEWIEHAARLGAEHLVFTGDLVDHANLDDATKLFRGLSKLGFCMGMDVTVVPGNHDVFPVGHFGGSLVFGDATENYDSFTRRARPYLSKQERLWPSRSWPFIRLLGEDVVIVALDTTHNGELGRFESGVGEFDDDDGAAILDRLDREHAGRKRVLAMHHWPFRWRLDVEGFFPWLGRFLRPSSFNVNFRDLAAIRRFIRACGFEVVLCGHQHGFQQRELGGIPIVSSAFQWDTTDRGIEFEVGFHLIDVGEALVISEHGELGVLEA
jgi:predicted phosphodiesterase